jgi:parallel beta-helix repeat protein
LAKKRPFQRARDPPTAPIYTADNITYTLTGNITSSSDGIVIERDNIVLDGAGFTVQGNAESGHGIDLSNRNNVTIENINMENFNAGTYLENSSNNMVSENNGTNSEVGIYLGTSLNNNSVSGNNITGNFDGIMLYLSSDKNTVSGNNITANNLCGIYLYSSSNNNISGNKIANNYEGIDLEDYSNINSSSRANID